jgi:hypothetical protein
VARDPLLPPPGSIAPDAGIDDMRRWIGSAANWMFAAYDWLGRSTGTSPLAISGNAATASTSSGVTFIMNAGTPEGNQQASPGVFYQDTDTNIVYVKTDGDDTIGWTAIT